ncbi:MAG: formate dehydrogenase accessory sulfurtransferase FdhD [Deltaproteobacteria bacterium]|jgi:FdhD protein|nr:formate dehydrogenase accessory sulfurtransferase FdhD [Deltaproteobacteria bacterium]
MKNSRTQKMIIYENGTFQQIEQAFILEEPLSIRIEGKPYSVVMRTPGDELAHAAGFCLAEGLVERPEDFATLGYCTEDGVNVVTATLVPERRKKVRNLLNRQGFMSQTSCGICGKELLADLYQIVKPVGNTVKMTIDQAKECVQRLSEHQELYALTGSSHAAMVFDRHVEPMTWAEDVGRHNALDKAIGKAFMNNDLASLRVAAMSSRLSFELVQKAARAGLEIMISMSRPTALAVELAASLNMTLACIGKKKGFMLFCGSERFSIPHSLPSYVTG